MKEDLETLLALEQAEIVAKYNQAHQAGSPVEPQEDADLSLCRVTDHHGFLHKKCRETWRADKQVKMLCKWDTYQHSKKMHGSIYKGVPLQVRGQVKSCLLDTEKVKSENKGKEI
ncbi:hypothetical protein VULLAG_LOCUS7416 [Vulpes lagopus]